MYRKRRGCFQREFTCNYQDSQGHIRRFLMAELTAPFPVEKYYINPDLGIQGFAETLKNNNVCHVFLHWFESQPLSEMVNNQINVLVSDQDIETARSLCLKRPGTIPVALYSRSGLLGANYHGEPYLPPKITKKILERRTFGNGSFSIPCIEDQFLSLAYHVIHYEDRKFKWSRNQKLYDINASVVEISQYGEYLTKLAHELGITHQITLADLHQYLQNAGWIAPRENHERLISHDEISADLVQNSQVDTEHGEIFVYLLSEIAIQRNLFPRIEQLLQWFGFEIIYSMHLPGTERKLAAQLLPRDWNKSSGDSQIYPEEPVYIIVAYDYNPRALQKIDKRYPLVRNQHFFFQFQISDILVSEKLTDSQLNLFYSTQNQDEAWEYVRIILPDQLTNLKKDVKRRVEEYKTREIVFKSLSNHGVRSKVEIIEFNQGKAVKKTYQPGCEKYLQREKFVLQELGPDCSLIPSLLEAGENYIIMPYYEDTFSYSKRKTKKIPRRIAKKGLEVMEFFFSKGYALIDFHPKNIIIDRQAGIKVIDFEYLYKYKTPPLCFLQSYDIVGIPADFDGEVVTGSIPCATYEKHWSPYICSDFFWPIYELMEILKQEIRYFASNSVKQRLKEASRALCKLLFWIKY